MRCSNCGKEVERVCSRCWRCKDCKLDCKEHFVRSIDGVIKLEKDKK